MTRKQMRDRVQYFVGLQDISAYDETGLVNDFLYEGTIDLLARTKCVARCLNLNVTAGTSTYKLDHVVLGLVEVDDGQRRKARRDESHRGLPAFIVYPSGTTPWEYDPSFTLIRSDILRVDPTPTVNGSIPVWAVIRPTKMVNETDSPGDDAYGGIPDEYQDAIVTYALWKASDYADDASGQQGERYRMLYEGQDGRGGRLGQIRVAVNKRGTARAPRRRVRMRGVTPKGAWTG